MLTMADRAQAFLASPYHKWPLPPEDRKIAGPGFLRMRQQLRAARRFKLDDDFVRRAVAVAACPISMTLKRAALANLPFDDIWIEFDQQVRSIEQERLGTARAIDDVDRGLVGFLIARETRAGGVRPADAWVASGFVAARDAEDEAELSPVSHLLGCNKGTDLFRKISSQDSAVTRLWTSGWGYRSQTEQEAFDLYLAGCTSPELNTVAPILAKETAPTRLFNAYRAAAEEQRGDLRFLATVLSMLNCAPVRYSHSEPKGRFTRRLNSMAFLDYHTVTVHADSVHVRRMVDRAANAEHRRTKRHEVRGHWALAELRSGVSGCRHLPVLGTRDANHATCERCNKRIVWKEHFERGDASLGWIQHDYEVAR